MLGEFRDVVERCRPLPVGLMYPLVHAAEATLRAWGSCDTPDADLEETRHIVALTRFSIGRTRELAEAEGGAE